MRDVAAGALDAVYLLELERGHRNERDRHNFEHYLADHGVTLIYEAEPEFSRYSQRQAMRNMQGLSAQYFSDYISESTRDKMRYLAREGKRVPSGIQHPFGLRHDAEHHLEPDPDWFPWARQMFERFAAGESLYAISQWLVAEGVPTQGLIDWERKPVDRRGQPKRKPSTPWSGTGIRRVLRDEAFHGVLVYARRRIDRPTGRTLWNDEENVIRIEDAWPKWIPDALWYAVQARLDTHRYTGKGRHIDHFALPSVRCGLCGCAVMGLYRAYTYKPTGAVSIFHRYSCSTTNRGGDRGKDCDLPTFRAPELDRAVVTALAAHLGGATATAIRNRALALLAERETALQRQTDDLAATLNGLITQRAQAMQALTMHQVAISEALLRELDAQVSALAERIQAETARLEAARAALRNIPAARAQLHAALSNAATLTAALQEADTIAQRQIIAQLVGEVHLFPDHAVVPIVGLDEPLVLSVSP